MNFLLTSVGRRSYLVDYFKEAVGNTGRIIVTNSVYTNTMSRADAYYISPIVYDSDYIRFLVDVCKKEKITAILSLFDIDLPVLSKNSEKFGDLGVTFVGPEVDTALISNDKYKTYEFFKLVGLETPNTYLSLDTVFSLVSANKIHFPLIIKPRWGMGSLGIYIANNKDELKILYQKCLAEIQCTYLNYESSGDIENAVVIQEFIVGQEHGLELYKDLRNTAVSTVATMKIAMRSGETDIGEIVSVEPFKEFSNIIANNLNFTGLLSVDCFLANGNVYGIEINSRISGHYPFNHLAGVRYPTQLLKWLKGEFTMSSLLKAAVGTRGCKELMPTEVRKL